MVKSEKDTASVRVTFGGRANKMKRKLWMAAVLMALSILLITIFQGYWLNKTYKDEKRNLSLKLRFILINSMQDLHRDNINLDSMLNLRRKSVGDSMLKIGKEKRFTSVKRDKKLVTIQISTDTERLPKPPIRHRRPPNFEESTSDTISVKFSMAGDTIPLRLLESSIADSLRREAISLNYEMKRLPPDTSTNEFGNGEDRKSNGGLAHYVSRKGWELLVPNPSKYLLKRIVWPIAFSIFMILLTGFSFVFLYRNLRNQQRLTELKNDFINNITHELKTPIATVGVAIEALKNFNAIHNPERTKEYLDISGLELKRLSILVDKVLKQSMFEKKDMELEKEPVDIKRLVEETLRSMQLQFEKVGAEVNFDSKGENFSMMADRLHITSVVYNLLDNALKYSAENPTINISMTDLGKNLSLSVADNGIGIPTSYTNKVFDKFFRVPHGNVHNIKGYGLGLSYVAQVIKGHGGTIKVESTEGKGSVFIINLPKNA